MKFGVYGGEKSVGCFTFGGGEYCSRHPLADTKYKLAHGTLTYTEKRLVGADPLHGTLTYLGLISVGVDPLRQETKCGRRNTKYKIGTDYTDLHGLRQRINTGNKMQENKK